MTHMPWFTQMLMAFAALVLAAVVYGFWSMAAAPMPKLDVSEEAEPAAGTPIGTAVLPPAAPLPATP